MTAMSQKATTPDSRNYISQLSSIITFFNKPSQGESIPVNLNMDVLIV